MWQPKNNLIRSNEALSKQLNKASEMFALSENGIYLYPFKISQGFNRVTNAGVDYHLRNNPNDFLGSINVQDINKPIIAGWADSWERVATDTGTTETLRVGKRIIGFNADTNWMLNIDTINLNEVNLTDTYTSHSLTLTFFYEPTIHQFNNTSWDWTDDKLTDYLYLVINPITQTQHFLVADSVTPIYMKLEENNTEPLGWTVSFSSLNLRFNNAGKNILNFVQCGAVGMPYAWPKEVKDEEGNIITVLDKTRAIINEKNAWDNSRLGVDTIQLDYDIAPAYSCVFAYGSPVPIEPPTILESSGDEILSFQFEHENTQLLLTSDTAVIDPNITLVTGQLNTKCVMVNQAKPVAREIYPDWLGWVNSSMSIETEKEFQGGLQMTTEPSPETTNPDNLSLSTKGFKFTGTLNYHNGITPYTPQTYDLFNPTPSEVNNNNALVYLGMDAISLDYESGYRFSLGNIPLIGGILKHLMLGLNPTWLVSTSKTASQILNANIPLNLMMTVEQWNMVRYGVIIKGDQPKSRVAPMEVFANSQGNYNVVLNKQCAAAYAWKLTNRIFNRANEECYTSQLGQKADKSGNSLTEQQGQYNYAIPSTNRFFITKATNKIVGKPNIRLVFRNGYLTNDQNLGTNIAQYWQQSNAKFKNDASLWTNEFIFEPDPANLVSTVTWPKATPNLPPPEVNNEEFGSEQTLLNDNNNKVSADVIDVPYIEGSTSDIIPSEYTIYYNLPNWTNLTYNYVPPVNSQYKTIQLECEVKCDITYSETRRPAHMEYPPLNPFHDPIMTPLPYSTAKTTNTLTTKRIRLTLNEDKSIDCEVLQETPQLFPCRNPNADIYSGGSKVRDIPTYTLKRWSSQHSSQTYTEKQWYWYPCSPCTYKILPNERDGKFKIGTWSTDEVKNISLNLRAGEQGSFKIVTTSDNRKPAQIQGKKYYSWVPALIKRADGNELTQYGLTYLGFTEFIPPSDPIVRLNYSTLGKDSGNWYVEGWKDAPSDYLTFQFNVINAKWFK